MTSMVRFAVCAVAPLYIRIPTEGRGNCLGQGSSTRDPRAACGPRARFVRPWKGISQNTKRYEY